MKRLNRLDSSVICEYAEGELQSAVVGNKGDLRCADLRGAYLEGADLRRASLEGADLRGADIEGADIEGANLLGADLRWANLRGANLRDADLRSADLRGAVLIGAENIPAYVIGVTSILPEGDIIGYKKAYMKNRAVTVIIKLKIPAPAKRLNSTGRKCRAEYADVMDVFPLNSSGDTIKDDDTFCSSYNFDFEYKVGETVHPTEPFCEDRWNECASGIHFFITREEAEAY